MKRLLGLTVLIIGQAAIKALGVWEGLQRALDDDPLGGGR